MVRVATQTAELGWLIQPPQSMQTLVIARRVATWQLTRCSTMDRFTLFAMTAVFHLEFKA
ncbi:hypothetical protein BLL52_2302 [Rhodoferax antarcticus ANT.BR]|uniref:Uncharacterized protein n=1 Tax=Rhodoferax antarcticus ANT.BR TaxID=1111071 RepID=A0A1Q8YDK0_9BURK|nr:hypothetical protein RA876_05715 [Rhodoferax antarcticus]OLP06072.1 hypothetical protein BLL52_2302 [Rhodoferax antarcticus ANT.BR]